VRAELLLAAYLADLHRLYGPGKERTRLASKAIATAATLTEVSAVLWWYEADYDREWGRLKP
jgi:hypothetical protein